MVHWTMAVSVVNAVPKSCKAQIAGFYSTVIKERKKDYGFI